MVRTALATRMAAMSLVAALAVTLTNRTPIDAAQDDFAAALPKPTKEHRVLRQDVGVWDAEIKTWMAGPEAEPTVSKGVERNRMLPGGLWLISDFVGDFGGMEFRGHGQTGYDTNKKAYVGSWVDSMTTSMMRTEGTYDEATGTLTLMGTSVDPASGQEIEHKMISKYGKDGSRSMEMLMRPKGSDGEFVKGMEITYTKRAGDSQKASQEGGTEDQ